MKIGDYIKKLRLERDWSQPQLAREIHASHGSERPPVSQSTIGNIEHGKGSCSIETLRLVGLPFRKSPGELLTEAEAHPGPTGEGQAA